MEPRLFSVFRTAARGLEAQRVALGAATENIANANTTRTEDGTPYGIKRAVHETEGGPSRFGRLLGRMSMQMQSSNPDHLGSAAIRERGTGELGPYTTIEEVENERLEYDPDHPDADEDGYVHYPDINVVEEMGHMISANRVYEANLTAVEAAKEMLKRTLEI